ncbi:MAG: hypothetical protein U1F41_02960 [Burkholderiales bacterium]
MTERDPKLEEALRAHLREAPPPALDAKILAAAHRAVESGPRKAGPEATRPQRWWMPLAAAAAIGVIAIGIVQQMPKEPAIDATSLTNTTTNAPAPAPSPKIAEKTASAAEGTPAPEVAPSQPAPAAIPPPAPAPARDALAPSKKQKEAEMSRGTAPTEAPVSAPSPAPAPPASSGLLASRENKAMAEPAPFPASPPPPQPLQKTESAAADIKRDEPREAQVADARKDALANRQAAAGAAAPPAAAPPASTSSFAARTRSQESVGALAQQTAKLGSEYDSLARDPDAWIVRIRKLRDEGNSAQAVRELREFRALVPDAEKRLPPDLKSLQP